ncbi:hypothetical protein C1O50_12140 [Akkermansia muciniphila]|nr:hypothetical protein C1O50_12140 [Akkermansia muciniphila]
MFPRRHCRGGPERRPGHRGPRHRRIPRWIQDLLNRLDGIPRILVKVECRQDVLLERERRRTDRTPAPAHAQRQHAGIHRHFPHDFSIDTSEDAPRKCAMRLISLLPGEFLP